MKFTNEININKLDIEKIISDLSVIWQLLGKKVNQIAIFGSVVKKSFEQARDIDIAIFVDSIDLISIKKQLSSLNLNFQLRTCKINDSYSGNAIPIDRKKEYDIVILNSKNPDSKFMLMNQDNMCFCDP